MKYLFSLFCCCFLLTNSYSTSLPKDTLLISNFSVNGLKLGMPIKNAKTQLVLCDSIVLDAEGDGDLYYVYYQGNTIMSYNSKNNSMITWIEVFSPIFHTKDGVRVNDNIRAVIGDAFDNIKQNEDIEDDENLSENIDKDLDTGYFYYFESNGKFEMDFFFNEEGIIQWIGLYCNSCK